MSRCGGLARWARAARRTMLYFVYSKKYLLHTNAAVLDAIYAIRRGHAMSLTRCREDGLPMRKSDWQNCISAHMSSLDPRAKEILQAALAAWE